MMSSQSNRLHLKRKPPLMLNGVEVNPKSAKMSRVSKSELINEGDGSNGPIIHEVFELEEPQVISGSQGNLIEQQSKSTTLALMDSNLRQVDDLLNKAVKETIGNISNISLSPSPKTLKPVTKIDPDAATFIPQSTAELPYVGELSNIPSVESIGGSPAPSPLYLLQLDSNTNTINSEPSSGNSMEVAVPQTVLLKNRELKLPAPNTSLNPKVILPKQNDLDGHLDEVQLGLDSLKDLLQGTSYSIDHATLSGVGDTTDLYNLLVPSSIDSYSTPYDPIHQLFGVDDEFRLFDTPKESTEEKKSKDSILGITMGDHPDMTGEIGSDLTTYNPCLFELAEDDSPFFENSDDMLLDDELDLMLTTDRNKLNGLGNGFNL